MTETSSDQTRGLDGKLGSSQIAFETIFGGFADESIFGLVYDVEGCGPIEVSYDDQSFAYKISIFSDRDLERPYDESDPADWSLDEASNVAASFLPNDFACGPWSVHDSPGRYDIRECESKTLLKDLPKSSWEYNDRTPSYGHFVIVLEGNDHGGYFLVNLNLAFDPVDFPYNE